MKKSLFLIYVRSSFKFKKTINQFFCLGSKLRISYNSIADESLNDDNDILLLKARKLRKTTNQEDFYDTVSNFSLSSPLEEKKNFQNKNPRSRYDSESMANTVSLKNTSKEKKNEDSLKSEQQNKPIQRRTKIPPRPDEAVNFEVLKGILKNAIGKDITRIPVPCNFSEP